jgi:hypothetical protein
VIKFTKSYTQDSHDGGKFIQFGWSIVGLLNLSPGGGATSSAATKKMAINVPWPQNYG